MQNDLFKEIKTALTKKRKKKFFNIFAINSLNSPSQLLHHATNSSLSHIPYHISTNPEANTALRGRQLIIGKFRINSRHGSSSFVVSAPLHTDVRLLGVLPNSIPPTKLALAFAILSRANAFLYVFHFFSFSLSQLNDVCVW